ncbi:39S ribosomal protein L21, mitochondrial [Condylostylus longicornis]|uniref:39S ribosomal protein L21, mitochondrial n=1 Tax=Condylostylus longicornis TaxID=2530218 RepID=UPI00244E258E|nr:39S ribosomal protein L21, mitochondrial [Condylostylus longicornis]
MFQLLSRLTSNKCLFFNNLQKLKNINSVSSFLPKANFSNTQLYNQKVVTESSISKVEPKGLIDNVKDVLLKNQDTRLFAVVHLCGKQFKITDGDIILVQGYWPPTNGDKIRLDKVLLVGANDFTLIGQPILEPGICDVQATIIEKTLSHTKTHFRKKRRKQYQRINFFRSPHTMIRINSININPNFNTDGKSQAEMDLKLF